MWIQKEKTIYFGNKDLGIGILLPDENHPKFQYNVVIENETFSDTVDTLEQAKADSLKFFEEKCKEYDIELIKCGDYVVGIREVAVTAVTVEKIIDLIEKLNQLGKEKEEFNVAGKMLIDLIIKK